MSATITVTLDTDRLLDAELGAVLVEDVAGYAPACLAVRAAIQSGTPVGVTVRHRQAAAWLTQYVQSGGDATVCVRRYTARDALAALWHVEVPKTVTDASIVQAGLLDVSVSAREGQRFHDLLLETFYSPLFDFGTLPVGKMGLLLNDYDADRWRVAAKRPLVAQTHRDRLTKWQERAQNDAVRSVVVQLRDDPVGLRRDLCAYALLRCYPPAVGRKVLGAQWDVLSKAKLNTDGLDFSHSDPTTVTEIEYYLTSIQGTVQAREDLGLVIRQMSGHLDCEFGFIEKQLHDHPEWLSAELLRQLERCFQPIEGRIGRSLAALRRLVKPPFPSAPDAAWDAEQWLLWVQGEYMPYYAWLEEQGKRDDVVAGYAEMFGDWFYGNFIALKNGNPLMFAFSALYGEKHQIDAPDVVALALIVDNFNFVHFDGMRRAFARHGISLSSIAPKFSLIPTATEVGKAPLIATTGDPIEVTANNYAPLVASEWGTSGPGKPAAYLQNVGALQKLAALNAGIYFLNYLPIDEALHQDAQETGRPHPEVIYEHLSTLAKSVSEFAKRFQLEKRLVVYVISDHGATRIAHGVVNVLDASFYKGIADKNHHRFLAVSDNQFKKLPQMTETQCYCIDRQKFKTGRNYLAARGYYRFQPTNEGFYVHGGLTPEEVVVPFARFTLAPVVPEAPTVYLVPSVYRYDVKSVVGVEVGNPNSFPIETVAVRLADGEDEEVVLDALGAKQQRTVELTTTLRKAIGGSNERTIHVRVSYAYLGNTYTAPDRAFQVTAKPVMEEKDDFGDIFDV